LADITGYAEITPYKGGGYGNGLSVDIAAFAGSRIVSMSPFAAELIPSNLARKPKAKAALASFMKAATASSPSLCLALDV
jgi:hypothetical protein